MIGWKKGKGPIRGRASRRNLCRHISLNIGVRLMQGPLSLASPKVVSLLLQCSNAQSVAARGVSSLLRMWTRPEPAFRKEYPGTSPEQQRTLPLPRPITPNGSPATVEVSRKHLSKASRIDSSKQSPSPTIRASGQAAISQKQCQPPSRVLRAALNERVRSYTKRSAKPRPRRERREVHR